MKIKLLLVLFLTPFVSYSQKAAESPQCNISSSENYIVRTTLINESQLDDPSGILNDPNIDYCDGIAIISINKREYKAKQYDYFKTKLTLASNGLEHLLEIGYIDDKKFLKEKIEYYSYEIAQLSAMLPLIQMQSNEEKVFTKLINNYTVLENKKSEIRLMRKKKWNDRIENFKKKLNI